MTPGPLSKTFNTVVEYVTIVLTLSIPVAVILLIVYSSMTIDRVSVHTVVDFVNDAS